MKTLFTILAVTLLVLSACANRVVEPRGPQPSGPSVPADSSSPAPVAAVGADIGDLDSQLSDDLGDFDSVSTDLAELENADY